MKEKFSNLNRRQRIIISITGIFLVLLILMGLTYAYFLTQIKGNENSKSIVLSTANLSLKYNDNSSELITSTKPIIPGEFTASKTFTVTNDGNGTIDSYAVILENMKVSYASAVGTTIKAGDPTSFVYPNDFEMTLTCTSNVVGKKCNGIAAGEDNAYLPSTDEILVTNSIDKNEVQTYVLTVTYVDSGIDQSADMNKTIEGKINIIDTKNTVDIAATLSSGSYADGYRLEVHNGPKVSFVNKKGEAKVVGVLPGNHTIYIKNATGTTVGTKAISIVKGTEEGINGNTVTITDRTRTINANVNNAYDITLSKLSSIATQTLENAILANGAAIGTKFNSNNEATASEYDSTIKTTADFTKSADGSDLTNNGLFSAEDEYTENTGKNSVYFRGSILNNYVDFAGMCWKVVRIEGDGSIKLILEDQDSTCAKSDGSWPIGKGYFGYTTASAGWYQGGDGFEQHQINYLSTYNSMSNKLKNFQTSKLSNYTSLLKNGNWCLNDTAYSNGVKVDRTEYYQKSDDGGWSVVGFDYKSRLNIEASTPSFKCDGTILNDFGDTTNMYVGAITVDEVMYAGAAKSYYTTKNNKIYLINGKNYRFNTLSPSHFSSNTGTSGYTLASDEVFIINANGDITSWNLGSSFENIRPMISLKSGTKISSGVGAKSSPYVIAG